MSDQRDESLVLQAQAGDQDAFEKLYRLYNNRICLYLARMIGKDEIAAELTQTTFLKAWQALSGLRQPGGFVGWLYTIATNEARNYQTKSQRLFLVSWESYDEDSEEVSQDGGLDDHVVQQEEEELLRTALAMVSINYRTCLVLYIVEGRSQRAIAELLDINENTVCKRIARGKEELRTIYRRLEHEYATFLRKKVKEGR